MEILTTSAQETEKLGQKIAADLTEEQGSPPTSLGIKRGAKILALYGELGSGKTTFVQGLGKGLGLPHRLLSPTFIVVREYPLHTKFFDRLYHFDLYRMENTTDLEGLGISDIFQNPRNLVVIEWAERLTRWSHRPAFTIRFSVFEEHKRKIVVE